MATLFEQWQQMMAQGFHPQEWYDDDDAPIPEPYEEELRMRKVPAQAIAFYGKFVDLYQELSTWSQATFGTDAERGPVGALKHLAKEVQETLSNPDDTAEYADCLILLLDASRRAGITPQQLVDAAYAKMQVNKARQWPRPVNDEPVEHIRGVEETRRPQLPTPLQNRLDAGPPADRSDRPE